MIRCMLFDKKFGNDFIRTVPHAPGTYTFLNEDGSLLYVGKAKSLNRRLRQYRAARSGKMRNIVKAAHGLRFETQATELDACLAELRQIQNAKPKLNVAGNYSHRYPFIGLRKDGTDTYLLFTSQPESFPEYSLFGAYRSRYLTSEAYFGMVRLLQFAGHPIPRKAKSKKRYSYEFGLRRLPATWMEPLENFFKGASKEWLALLFERLLDHAGARSKASEVQEAMDALVAFWDKECEPLAKVIEIVGFDLYPVPQRERDPLFVRAGFELREESNETA
jgi:hypothetical protein